MTVRTFTVRQNPAYRPARIRFPLMLWLRPADLLVLLAAVAAGCATASAPAPERPARAAHPVRGDTAAPSHSPVEWTPRRIAGTARYVVRSSTTVSLTSDSAGAPAPIETRA